MRWQFASLWDEALSFDRFVKESKEQSALWTGVYRLARIPQWSVAETAALGSRFHIVVLAEDWCGDAANSVPVLAKWAELAPNVELRILHRDGHPEVMDHYLTGTARSIPVVIVLDEHMEELGWWGPRPAALQAWSQKERDAGREKKGMYPEIRRWYAKDHGESTIREVLAVMRRASEVHSVPS